MKTTACAVAWPLGGAVLLTNAFCCSYQAFHFFGAAIRDDSVWRRAARCVFAHEPLLNLLVRDSLFAVLERLACGKGVRQLQCHAWTGSGDPGTPVVDQVRVAAMAKTENDQVCAQRVDDLLQVVDADFHGWLGPRVGVQYLTQMHVEPFIAVLRRMRITYDDDYILA